MGKSHENMVLGVGCVMASLWLLSVVSVLAIVIGGAVLIWRAVFA